MLKKIIGVLFLSSILLMFGFSIQGSAEENSDEILEKLTEEDIEEISSNMESVSPDNPVSTYTTESGIEVERTLTIEPVESNSGSISPLSTFYRETIVSLQEEYWIQNVSSATFTGSWRVGVARDSYVDILSWDSFNLSVSNGSEDSSNTSIPVSRGTSSLNPAIANVNSQLTLTSFPGWEPSSKNVDWDVEITPSLNVNGSLTKN